MITIAFKIVKLNQPVLYSLLCKDRHATSFTVGSLHRYDTMALPEIQS